MSSTKTTSAYPLHPKEKLFFPNLDALRFFSFLGVFLYHSYKVVFNYLENTHPGFYQTMKFLFQNGNLGVNFFFVLSGFLITFLLLKEKKKSGDIHLRNFYIRRILRIWPLFYLCVLTGFVIFPFFKSLAGATPSENANLVYYLLFINNFDFIHHWPQVPDALILVVLWSVAVEEQFYLAWPVIVKLTKNIILPVAFTLVVISSLVFRFFHSSDTDEDYGIRYFHTLSVIGDMAIGGLLAYYTSFETRFLKWIRNMSKGTAILIYVSAIALSLFKTDIFKTEILVVFERLVISIFYGLIILEQAFATRPLYPMSRLKRTSKLGVYTYGLYCIHFMILSVTLALAGKLHLNIFNTPVSIGIVITSLLFCIILSWFLYRYFEKPFLKLKERFAFITK